ncbi:MAG: HD-GYP domain-containing protein [Sulfurisoma sp.]|nr:HD-GYP domain-containing protein [Sulfurisoma sp.]
MKRRDRNALLLYGVFGFVVVVIEEVAVYEFHMVERFGIAPLLVRGVVFLLLTTALWAALLRANRRLVCKLMHDKQASYESVLLAYDNALGLKDAYTGGHGRRVASHAHAIASALGLPHEQVDSVREAASLHDIGKIGIPDAILTKPGKLTADEFGVIKQHPVMGAAIVESIPLLARHAPAVRHHHERFDGSGYPDGLRGHDIPLAARIIAVADVLDALGSDRSYRGAMPFDAVVAEIGKAAGTHFDPKIVGVISKPSFRHALKSTAQDHSAHPLKKSAPAERRGNDVDRGNSTDRIFQREAMQ